MIKKFTYIDLFAGAGGLSEGFVKAGFSPIAHVEMDSMAAKTLETRLIYYQLVEANKLDHYHDYLRGSVTRDNLVKLVDFDLSNSSVINRPIGDESNKDIFGRIDNLSKNTEIDVLIGGPPCQAYSLVGRARDTNGMKDDPRNFLYKEYAKYLKMYSPKVFVFENVLGLLTAEKGLYFKNMKKYFKRVGYELDFQVLHSEDYGVLQKRRRIILIGWRKNLDFEYPVFKKSSAQFIVNDLLADLQNLKPGEQNITSKYTSSPSTYLEKYNLRNGIDFVSQHITRPHNTRDLAIYKIAIEKMHQGERLRYSELPSELKTHKNQSSFLDRFKVVNHRGLSHTMVAHIAKDGHHYIHPDLNQIRSISVREAARIQSFSDDFYFEGGRSAAFKQIGNAVPPLMAAEIANQIKLKLQ